MLNAGVDATSRGYRTIWLWFQFFWKACGCCETAGLDVTVSPRALSFNFPPPKMDEFDLLAGIGHGDDELLRRGNGKEAEKVLLWKKLETNGHVPSAREGHSAVVSDTNIFIFGGIEAGQRVNSLIRLDLLRKNWSSVKCLGTIPSPRCQHAVTILQNLMIVHGGEGLKQPEEIVLIDKPIDEFPSSTIDRFGGEMIRNRSVPGILPGVCPGDSIQGLKLGPTIKVQKAPSSAEIIFDPESVTNPSNPPLTCFDDFYACDLDSLTWFRFRSSLAPLPRKGHTLNLVNLHGDTDKPSLLVFGGYSIDNLTVSNSVLVCSSEHVLRYYNTSQAILKAGLNIADYESTSGGEVKKPLNEQYDLQPIVWRTLKCKGKAPCGRYKHSSTVVMDNSGAHLLIIVGGLGMDTSRPLNDVHVLQCDTLTWIALESHKEGPKRGISSDGPSGGIFGHTAFPFLQYTSSLNIDQEDLQHSQEILLFGGSYNPASAKSSCYSRLFSYNYNQHTWRTIHSGHEYPSSRTNHTATAVVGWAPIFEVPFQPAMTPTPKSSSSQFANNNKPETSNNNVSGADLNRNCVIVFGGVTAISAANDTWALDLQWRTAGLDQYDNNLDKMVMFGVHRLEREHAAMEEEELQQRLLRTASSASHRIVALNNTKYLNRKQPSRRSLRNENSQREDDGNNSINSRSKSMTQLPTNNNTGQQIFRGSQLQINTAESPEMSLAMTQRRSQSQIRMEEEMVLKLRKERAAADIRVQEEQHKSLLLEALCKQREEEIESIKQQASKRDVKYEQEIADLKERLQQSIDRERKLRDLNEEAQELFTLFGVERLSWR